MKMIHTNNKLKEISMAFREIDKERTGMITSPEMDDIFRFHYPEDLKEKHIYDILKPFEVVSNKILIEYKKFREWLVLELK
jgi:Ca2+-binding EF-hand superfamily protein